MRLKTLKVFDYRHLYILADILLFTFGALMNESHQFITGFSIILYAIIGYLYIVLFVAERNWLDIRAIFNAIWLVTIGLAVLRLADYQEPWQTKTWVILGLTEVLFQIAATFGISFGKAFKTKSVEIAKKIRTKRIGYEFNGNRLFWIAVVASLIGIACFTVNVFIKGFIPCFSNATDAYTTFYTKWHVFSVAATGVSGICIYCVIKQKLSVPKKILLVFFAFYHVILLPIMVVSRGIFLVAALSVATVIFYTCGKRFWVLVLSIALMGGVYLGTSVLRNYTDEQLDVFFEPSDIETVIPAPQEPGDGENPGTTFTFRLPPKVSFVYSYLTQAHDNFNCAVKHAEKYTWGLRQLKPFNVILNIGAIDKALEDAEWYQVNPYLNTINYIGDAYYDLHEFGVILLMLVSAFAFGLMQTFASDSGGCFSLMTLGNAMGPVVLCFFASWLSNFTLWMIWGVTLITFIVSGIKFSSADKSPKKIKKTLV